MWIQKEILNSLREKKGLYYLGPASSLGGAFKDLWKWLTVTFQTCTDGTSEYNNSAYVFLQSSIRKDSCWQRKKKIILKWYSGFLYLDVWKWDSQSQGEYRLPLLEYWSTVDESYPKKLSIAEVPKYWTFWKVFTQALTFSNYLKLNPKTKTWKLS